MISSQNRSLKKSKNTVIASSQMEGKSERKSNAKVTALREIEVFVQKCWEKEKVFQEDAPVVIESFS